VARNGNGWHAEWQKRQRLVRMWRHTCRYARGWMWGRWANLRLYAIVKVLARRYGPAVMELKYHRVSGMSSDAAAVCRVGNGIAAITPLCADSLSRCMEVYNTVQLVSGAGHGGARRYPEDIRSDWVRVMSHGDAGDAGDAATSHP